MVIGFGFFFGALEGFADGEVPFETMVRNGFWWYFGIGVACILPELVAGIFQAVRRRRSTTGPVLRYLEERIEKHKRVALEELLVPAEAVAADVFSETVSYPFNRPFRETPCVLECHVFRDGNALCLACGAYVIRIPWEKIVRVERVERRMTFANWNKPELPMSPVYRPYKIRIMESGRGFSVPSFYRVTVGDGEEWMLLFPPYEYERLAPLLGASVSTLMTVKK